MGNAGQHSTDEDDDGGNQGEDEAWLESAEGWQSKADRQTAANEGTTTGGTQQPGRNAASGLSANDQSPTTENQAVTTESMDDEPGNSPQSGKVPMEDSLFGPPQSKSKTPANTSFGQQQHDTTTESSDDSAAGGHPRQSEHGAAGSTGQATEQGGPEQPTDASTTSDAEPADDPEQKDDDEPVADFSSLKDSDGIADKIKEALEYFKGGERPYMKYSNAQERIIVVIVEGTIIVSFLYALIAKPSLILWATLSVALYGFYYLWRGVYAIERIADGLDLDDDSPEDVASDGRVRNKP